MNVVAALRDARARVERGWTRGVYARDKYGHKVYVFSPSAAQWCPLGALHYTTLGPIPGQDAINAFRTAIGGGDIPEWNDAPERKKAEVLAAFDRAIELAARGETL